MAQVEKITSEEKIQISNSISDTNEQNDVIKTIEKKKSITTLIPDNNNDNNLISIDNFKKNILSVSTQGQNINTSLCAIKVDHLYDNNKKKLILRNSSCLRDKKTNSFIKVYIKNNWRTDIKNIDSVPIQSGPSEYYETIDRVSIFNIYYVVKKNEKHSLISNSAYFQSTDKDIDDNILGWINNEYCLFWDSRLGVFFNKSNLSDRERIPIFNNKSDAEKYFQTGIIENVLAFENPNITGDICYNTNRFPILEIHDKCIRICWIGKFNFKAEVNTNNPKKITKLERYKNQLNSLVENIKRIDLLFIIDATKGMEKYFEAIADGITEFNQSLPQVERNRYRVAIAIYRDITDQENVFKLLLDFSNFKSISITSEILRVAAKMIWSNPEDKDIIEDGYLGLYKSISKVHWEKNHFRASVIIGDYGSHEPSGHDEIGNPIVSDTIVKKLGKHNIQLYALNVGSKNSDSPYHSEMFMSQMKNIMNLSNSGGIIKATNSSGYNELIEVNNKTKEFAKDIFHFSSNVSAALESHMETKSFWDICIGIFSFKGFGVNITQYTKEFMNRSWLSEDELLTLEELKYNICETGWVIKESRNKKQLMDLYFFCTRSDLDLILGTLSSLGLIIKDRSHNLSTMIKKVLKRSTDKSINKGEKISDFLNRTVYHTSYSISDTLNHTTEEIQHKIENTDGYRLKLYKKLMKKYEILKSILEEKEVKLKWDRVKLEWIIEEIKPKDWWFYSTIDEKNVWIPIKYLP